MITDTNHVAYHLGCLHAVFHRVAMAAGVTQYEIVRGPTVRQQPVLVLRYLDEHQYVHNWLRAIPDDLRARFNRRITELTTVIRPRVRQMAATKASTATYLFTTGYRDELHRR